MRRRKGSLLPLLLLLAVLLTGCSLELSGSGEPETAAPGSSAVTLENIPAYAGQPYTALEGNVPSFTEEDLTAEPFESYSPLDSLGRCGAAYACLGQELMPREERGDIHSVRPSGWHSVRYDFVDGQSLYNRCHLIGFQLSGENANEKNLITGTRYMNVEGMLPFENMTADYIKETGGHVLYRVTPDFQGEELVARGVEMEAMSVEDGGEAVSFHVYVYNVQPGVRIDYATGDSQIAPEEQAGSDQETEETYILNTNTRRFHLPSCSSVSDIKDSNRKTYRGSRESLIRQGYSPCGSCGSG